MSFAINSNIAVSAVGVGSVSRTAHHYYAGRDARNTRRQDDRVTLIAMLVVVLVALSVRPAAADPLSLAERDQIVALRGEVWQFYKAIPQVWFVRTPPSKKDLPPKLIPEAAKLMERLLKCPCATRLPSDEDKGLYANWIDALKIVFRIQTVLPQLDLAQTFAFLDALTVRLGPPDSAPGYDDRAKAIATLYDAAFARWRVKRDPCSIMPRFLKLEKVWIAPLGTPLPDWWISIRLSMARSLYLHAPASDPQAESTPESSYLSLASRWIRDYLNDASIPIADRSWCIRKLGVSLHSMGKPDLAATIMDYAKSIPGSTPTDDDPNWLRARFFAAQMGHGDRVLARTILSKMDALIGAGRLSQEDGRYGIMLENYYANLPLPDLDHQQQVRELLEKMRRAHAPLQKKTPATDQ